MFEADVRSGSTESSGGSYPLGVTQFPGKNTGRILVVDDQFTRRRSLHTTLFSLGFEISEASTGEEAAALCRIIRCDAVLIAINTPGKAGIEMCMELRRLLPRTAILAMSSCDDEQHKVEVLDAGADDYVRPSHMRELTARVRAAMRRSRATASETSPERIVIGEIAIWPSQRMVTKGGIPIHLTPREFDLLRCLMAHAGLPMTHAGLLRTVWGADADNQVEYLRTYIRQLRRKLEDDPAHPRYLLTNSHIGYRFAAPESFLPTPRSAGSVPPAPCAGNAPPVRGSTRLPGA
jgi:two-component system KDP operon response regulator KdpE